MGSIIQKRLRRLPHIYARVLELPLQSDAEVSIQESRDCFRFVAGASASAVGDVSAHIIETVSGITKVLIVGSSVLELSWDDLEIDKWRFRLPPYSRPEKVRVGYVDGKLVVTVPKVVAGVQGRAWTG